MKIAIVLVLLIVAARLRNACDIILACNATWVSPISPSISSLGTNAATESITITLIAPLATKALQISNACSPLSGWDNNNSSVFTPILAA